MNGKLGTRRFIAWALLTVLAVAGVGAAGNKERQPERRRITLVVSETANELTCIDADGNQVRLSKKPARAIVNYTSLVSLWYRAGGTAVGMPDTANLNELPEAARGIATTGHTANPNLEKVLSLEPTLVILAANMEKQRAMTDVLRGAGAQVLILSYENYGDFVGILDLFYRLNGRDPAADTSSIAMQNAIEAMRVKTAAQPPVKFLSLFASARDVQAETDRAHTAFMAAYLGATNITTYAAPSASQTRVPFSIERIHMEDPDVIFVTTMGNGEQIREKMRKDFMESEVWQGLKAVKSGRVYFLPNELFLYKPNDRFPEAFEQLSRLLYPTLK
jgi:iron complex transport system substrate-binding protein